MQQRESITVIQLVTEFGLRMDQVPDISPSEDVEALKANVEEFKKVIKSQYRKLIKKYHPDVYPDKKEAHEKLIRLNKLMKCVNLITVQIGMQQPVRTVHFRFYGGYSSTTTGGTSSTSTGFTWGNWS